MMTAPPLAATLFMLGSLVAAWLVHQLLWRRLILKLALSDFQTKMARWTLWGLACLFPIGMLQLLLMRHVPRLVASPAMWAAFTWLGFVLFLLQVLVVFEFVRIFIRLRADTERKLARASAVIAAALGIFSLWQASQRPVLHSTYFEIEGLPDYRIVQLSDLHIGPTLGRSFAQDVVQRTNSMRPDLVVISGDMVDGSVAELTSEVAPLKDLRATDGVVFVLGNHEYLSDAKAWVHHAQSFGWSVLCDERLQLPRLDVIGFDEFSDPEADIYAASSSAEAHHQLPDLSRRRPTITVSHSPGSFAAACAAGVDLALAGHTHGGQIFPFGLLERLQQGYLAGPYRCGPTQLYVSPGAGYWGPPMRFGSRAEISVLELLPARRNDASTDL